MKERLALETNKLPLRKERDREKSVFALPGKSWTLVGATSVFVKKGILHQSKEDTGKKVSDLFFSHFSHQQVSNLISGLSVSLIEPRQKPARKESRKTVVCRLRF